MSEGTWLLMDVSFRAGQNQRQISDCKKAIADFDFNNATSKDFEKYEACIVRDFADIHRDDEVHWPVVILFVIVFVYLASRFLDH